MAAVPALVSGLFGLVSALIGTIAVLAQTAGDDDTAYTLGAAVGAFVISGGIGALIGMTKDRVVLGLLLGGFLGCIGWIIIALMGKKIPKY
jgi:hypothetical protein